MQPLAEYSNYIMTESPTSDDADPMIQEFLSVFFSLRNDNQDRYKVEAAKLLKRHELITTRNGITFYYQINNKEVFCTTSPAFLNTFDCPLSDLRLGWRKSVNRIILVDRIADYEARAKLHYSVQH